MAFRSLFAAHAEDVLGGRWDFAPITIKHRAFDAVSIRDRRVGSAVRLITRMRGLILVVVMPGLMLGLSAAAIPAAPPSGGTLVIGLGGEPGSLSPCPMSSTDERAFVQMTYDG